MTYKKIREDFLKMFIEIEFNAEEDTLFERMTLSRMIDYADSHFNTNLNDTINKESLEANDYLQKHTFAEWRREIRKRRVATLLSSGNETKEGRVNE
jgi:hypothetical protein